MEQQLARELFETQKELFETQKQLTIQYLAHTQILCALLNVIDQRSLLRLRQILEVQSASGEFQGIAEESCRLALQTVSLATEGGGAPDPRKILRLIEGGKKDS